MPSARDYLNSSTTKPSARDYLKAVTPSDEQAFERGDIPTTTNRATVSETTKPIQIDTPPKKDWQEWRYQDMKAPTIREATADVIPQNQNSRDMKLSIAPTPDKERSKPALNTTDEPIVQGSLDRAPEGTRIQNTESPYWKLPNQARAAVDRVMTGRDDIETKRIKVQKNFGFDPYVQPPYNLEGTTAGMTAAFIENMFSRVGTLPPAENANEYAVMGAGLAGSVVPGALLAGATGPLGPVGQSMVTGAGANLAATPGNADPQQIIEQILLGAGLGVVPGIGLTKTKPVKLGTASVEKRMQLKPWETPTQRMGAPEASPQLNRVSEIDPTVPKTEPVVSNSRQVPTSTETLSQPPVASVQGGNIPSPVVKEPSILDTPVQAIDDAAIPPTDPPRPKSPTLVPVDDTPDAIGLKMAEIDRIRDGLELDRLPQAQRVTMEETLSRANEENTAARADAVAQRVLAGGEMSDTELAGMTIRVGQLANESDDLLADIIRFQDEGNTVAENQARMRVEEIRKQVDVLTRAADMANTEAGRSLNLRKLMVNLEDYSLAKVTNRARERKGSALTEKETARIERVVNERNEIQKQLDEALKQNEDFIIKQEEEIARRVLQAEATRANIRRVAAKSREAIRAERADLKRQLADIGYRVNDITGVTTEGAYIIGKIAISYFREGITDLAEIVKLVKNDIPDLSDYDVHRSIGTRDPNIQARMMSEAVKKERALKSQARILADIEDAEKGIFRPTNKRKPSDAEVSRLNRQLSKLRNAAYSSGIHPDRLEKAIRTINELQDRIEKHYTPLTRRLKPEITSELAAMKEQIADLRKHLRLDDELADLNEQIRTGEFKVPQKKMRRPESPEIARLRMARDRARNKIEAELEILAPMTGRRVFGETVNTLRTLKATADLSATLRQGLVLSVTRPGTAFKAFGQGVKSMFSKHTAEQIDYAIKNRETAYLGDRAGLYLAELADARLTSHEEAFMSRFVEKVPVMGTIVRGSERAMVTQLNILRSAAFDEFIRVNPNATATELKAWANFVNVASGRGDLGRLAGAADYLSTVFFAPRFAASRFQTPYMFLKYAKEPRVRKAIAKDLVATVGLGSTVLALAGMAGADVSGDPRDPDFGKIKIGPTRIDVWAGFQQPARLIANPTLGWAFAKKANKRRDDSFIEQAMRFASFKLAPTITLPSELLSGRTVIGEKIDRVDALANAVIPMMYEDVFDAYRQQGLGMAALTTGLNLVGVSTNTYQKKK